MEYFTFIRLDCEKLRKGLGDAARDLANTLLQNVVDTYRKEDETICAAFEEIERVALNAPKSTKEMIELGEYMLHVKNKRMLELTDEIENSKKHLLYIIDVHIFSHEDIDLNTKTLGWPVKIKPVFEQNTEIVEDCKVTLKYLIQILPINGKPLRMYHIFRLGLRITFQKSLNGFLVNWKNCLLASKNLKN